MNFQIIFNKKDFLNKINMIHKQIKTKNMIYQVKILTLFHFQMHLRITKTQKK